MRKIGLLCAVTFGVVWMCAADVPKGWSVDFSAAQKIAAEKKRPMLLLFTGSDWCPYCIRLERNVLSKDAFRNFAGEKLVPVYIDFPRLNKLTPEQLRSNKALASRYKIEGFPTVVLTDASGKEIRRFGYTPGFMKALEDAVSGKPAGDGAAGDDGNRR